MPANTISDDYENWFVQDQAVFAWLLTTISGSVLPRVLSCDHGFEVWETIHNHFYAVLRAKARQLHAELKTMKKGACSMSKYVLPIRTIADSLLSVSDPITEQDRIDSIIEALKVLPKNMITSS